VVLSCGDRALCAWSYPVGTGLYACGPTSWEQGSMCAVLPCGDRALCAWSYLVVTGLFVRGPILWGQGSMHVVLPRGTGFYACGPTSWGQGSMCAVLPCGPSEETRVLCSYIAGQLQSRIVRRRNILV